MLFKLIVIGILGIIAISVVGNIIVKIIEAKNGKMSSKKR